MKKKTKKKVKKTAKKAAHGHRRSQASDDIRSLTKVSGGASYAITLPRAVIKSFKWKERQKLKLDVNEKTKTITIRDWKR